MERIGIFGGTFNPPHIGHIEAAKQAISALNLDILLLIPDKAAPHKTMPHGSPSPEQRLEMLRLAVADIPGIRVSDMELTRDTPSYTYLTVEALRRQYPHEELILLMGTDMFLSFRSWRNARQILESVSLAVFYRGEKGETDAIRAEKAALESEGHTVYLVENHVTPISSTQLRRMLAFRCAGDYLPPGVEDYILRQGLYDTRADWRCLPMDELEKVVVSLLKANRVAHVLGCRDTAVALAERWGADPTDAARAGLLHDITKALDGSAQLTLCRAYGKILDDFSMRYPKTLHALTGSLVAERIFGEKESVVSAICWHTTGRGNMTLLEKIIYIADYIEPNRDIPGVENLRRLAFTDLDEAMVAGLNMTLTHLAGQKAEISPETSQALAWLTRK